MVRLIPYLGPITPVQVLASLIAGFSDLYFHPVGYFWMAINCTMTAANTVLCAAAFVDAAFRSAILILAFWVGNADTPQTDSGPAEPGPSQTGTLWNTILE